MAAPDPYHRYGDDSMYYAQQQQHQQQQQQQWQGSQRPYRGEASFQTRPGPSSASSPQRQQDQRMPSRSQGNSSQGERARQPQYSSSQGYSDPNQHIPTSYPPAPTSDSYAQYYATPSSSSPPRMQRGHTPRLDAGHQPFQGPESYAALHSPASQSHVALTPPSPTQTEGLYPDRPIKLDRLSPEQRKIAETFPKDLDEEGTTMKDSYMRMLRDWRSWVKWSYWYYYLLFIAVIAVVVVFVILHRRIIDWLTPVSIKINSVVWGWIIPVAILFVISFPPLFGHEIIGVLCGIVYPFWIAFGIVALGTLLGEWGNFWAFGACLQKTAQKYERKSLNYACMAHIVREGGLFTVLVARLSAIPGHFTTAVFSTVGMSFWIFTIATLLSMPKQMAVVYVGYAIRSSADGEESTASKIVKWVILVITGIITVLAAWYLYRKMEVARPEVQRKLRLNRYTLLSEASGKGAPTPVTGILLNKEGGRDSFATMRRTETGQSGERVPSGSVRPQNASAAGDLGIIVDPYGHYDEDQSYAQGPVKSDQAAQYYPSRNADHGYGYPNNRGRNNVDGIQMRQLAPPRGASLGRGVTTMADAGRSTDQLLPARGGEEIPFPTSSSPPRTHLQLHRGSFIPHHPSPPREHHPAAEQQWQHTPPRLEPLDVDVLLAATTRSTPPRPAGSSSAEAEGSASARPSPPRYETLDWAEAREGHQDGSPRRR